MEHAWPHYLGYAISFLIIGMIWISHHTIFRLIRGVDHRAMVLNIGLLGLVVFIPFPTEIFALYINQNSSSERAEAAAFYGLSLAVATLMLALLWHSLSHHRRLIKPWVSDDELRHLTRRFYLTPVLYLVATGLALLNAALGLVLFLAIGCGYLLHTGTRVAPIHPDDAINGPGIPYESPHEPPAETPPDDGPRSGFDAVRRSIALVVDVPQLPTPSACSDRAASSTGVPGCWGRRHCVIGVRGGDPVETNLSIIPPTAHPSVSDDRSQADDGVEAVHPRGELVQRERGLGCRAVASDRRSIGFSRACVEHL